MNVEFKYLSKPQTISLPDNTRILNTENFELVQDTYIAIIKSLLQPLGYERSLFDMAKSVDTACVTIDAMIPNPILDMVLRPVLKTLHAAGLAYTDICILFAAEYPLEVKKSMVRKKVSKDIRDSYHIEFHDNFTLTNHQLAGDTSRQTPVYMDRRFLRTQMKIAIGRVIPHFAVGLFDSISVVGLGLTSPDTLKALYALARQDIHENGTFDTVMHRDIVEICDLAQVDFIVNILMSAQERVMNIFSGKIKDTYQKTESVLQSQYTANLKEPADAAVVTSGLTGVEKWYLLIETVCNAAPSVREHGSIVLLSDLLYQMDNAKIRACTSLEDFLSIFLEQKRWMGIFEILEEKLKNRTVYFPIGV
ncbi:MAG: lactate racemase domain-containing protein [candidate division KSB1 bacterium]|nr:lactate racemase domain-containing protein [candidate division KSB1 bacterium]